MKSYFFCLFGAALLSGVVSMAAEGSGFEKHIRYVCALVCTIAVIAPLAKADLSAIELPVVAETEVSGGESTVVDIAEQNAKEYISSLLMKKIRHKLYRRTHRIRQRRRQRHRHGRMRNN